MVAVTDASEFALQPRLVGDDQIVVPLPPERAHLVKVEVFLLIARRDTGEIMAQEKKSFSRNTLGSVLRFYLPVLPGGDYLAQVRTTSSILEKTGEVLHEVQLLDQAQVSLHSDQARQTQRKNDFLYHFNLHRSIQDAPELASDGLDDVALDLRVLELRTALHNSNVAKVTMDCWASSDGDASYNMQVSIRRCKWVRSNVLEPSLGQSMSTNVIEVAHGEDNPHEPEPVGISRAALQGLWKRNRLVMLTVYTTDWRGGPIK